MKTINDYGQENCFMKHYTACYCINKSLFGIINSTSAVLATT